MDKVRENIMKAKIVVTDLTGKHINDEVLHNAYVYYELGLSHGYAKKVIILTQNIDDLPFDLRHLRMVIYKTSNKAEFVKKLLPEIEYMKSL
mgnify:FL=1